MWVLIENGGYCEKEKAETTLINLQSLQTWVIAVGTFVASVGTIGLLIWEIRKIYPYFLEFWKY